MFIQTKSREIGSEMPSSVFYMAGYRNQSKEKRITRLGYMCVCVFDCGLFGIAGQERLPEGQELVQGIISRATAEWEWEWERETVEIGRKLFCFCVSCEMCLMSCSEYQQSCKKSLQNVARKKGKRTKGAAELGKGKWEMGNGEKKRENILKSTLKTARFLLLLINVNHFQFIFVCLLWWDTLQWGLVLLGSFFN